MSLNYKKVFLLSFFLSGFVNLTCVFASSNSITTEDIAASLSDTIEQNKKEVTKIIKSNKRLIKSLKGLTPKEKTTVTKVVNDLDSSIESGDEQNIIESNLDSILNQ